MSVYRIAPEGADRWKVQQKVFGLLWCDMHRSTAYDLFETVSYPTEAEAAVWIEKALDYERRSADWHRKARERRRTIQPRLHPPA